MTASKRERRPDGRPLHLQSERNPELVDWLIAEMLTMSGMPADQARAEVAAQRTKFNERLASMASTRQERRTCMVCMEKFKTGAWLIGGDPDRDTKWGLCQTHEGLRNRNLIALVEIDPEKSPKEGNKTTPEAVQRTGTVAYIGANIYSQVFNGEVPETGVAFVTPDVIATLQQFKALWGGELPH